MNPNAPDLSRSRLLLVKGLRWAMLLVAAGLVWLLIERPEDEAVFSNYLWALLGVMYAFSILRSWAMSQKLSAWDLSLLTITVVALLFWV